MPQLTLFLLFLRASLLSTGGFGNVPILHADLVRRGWATNRQFGEALAVGQISPGPNGLWVVSLAYLIDGPLGALLSVVGLTVPPLLILVVAKAHARYQDHPGVVGFVRGLTIAVIGIFVPTLWTLLAGNGLTPMAVIIAMVAAVFSRRVPILLIIAAGAVAGILIRR